MLCVLFSFWCLLILVASVNLTGHSWLHAYGHRATVEEWWDWVSVFFSFLVYISCNWLLCYVSNSWCTYYPSILFNNPPYLPPSIFPSLPISLFPFLPIYLPHSIFPPYLPPYLPISLPNHFYDRLYRNTFFSYFSSTFLFLFFYFDFDYFLTITYSHLVLTVYRNYFYMLSAAFSSEMWSGVLKIPTTDSASWRGTCMSV